MSKNSKSGFFLHGGGGEFNSLNIKLMHTRTPGLIISTQNKPIIFTQIQKQKQNDKTVYAVSMCVCDFLIRQRSFVRE